MFPRPPGPSLAAGGKTPHLPILLEQIIFPLKYVGPWRGGATKGRPLQVPADLLAKSSYPTLALGLRLMPQTHPRGPSRESRELPGRAHILDTCGFHTFCRANWFGAAAVRGLMLAESPHAHVCLIGTSRGTLNTCQAVNVSPSRAQRWTCPGRPSHARPQF